VFITAIIIAQGFRADDLNERNIANSRFLLLQICKRGLT
jgi:hypothetical protein